MAPPPRIRPRAAAGVRCSCRGARSGGNGDERGRTPVDDALAPSNSTGRSSSWLINSRFGIDDSKRLGFVIFGQFAAALQGWFLTVLICKWAEHNQLKKDIASHVHTPFLHGSSLSCHVHTPLHPPNWSLEQENVSVEQSFRHLYSGVCDVIYSRPDMF